MSLTREFGADEIGPGTALTHDELNWNFIANTQPTAVTHPFKLEIFCGDMIVNITEESI